MAGNNQFGIGVGSSLIFLQSGHVPPDAFDGIEPNADGAVVRQNVVVLNGLVFLTLMLLTERSASLDLRRASKLLEILAIVHTLSALFANALNHRTDPNVQVDVWLYLGAAAAFMVLAPFRSRWRLLVGGLAGCGLGSYLLVDLGLVNRLLHVRLNALDECAEFLLRSARVSRPRRGRRRCGGVGRPAPSAWL